MAYSTAFSQSISIMAYIGAGSQMEDCKYLSIKNISDKLKIPVPSIKRLISLMKKNGLLDTKAGIDGGLALSKDTNQISLLDIFNSIEGVNPLFKIYDSFDFDSFDRNKTEVETWVNNEKNVLNTIEEKMLLELKNTSLADILNVK